MTTATIKYDRTVTNLIDELSATGHVTHTAYKKKSVTLHHNAGRLSHQGVLQVWRTRPASAHFDVDGAGAVAQYVKVNEYAWAAGNLKGNQESIHIEMANATLAPGYTVAEATWKNAARLAGWLHFKVIGARPTKNTLFYHHHWSSTACAGPYMDKIYSKVLAESQRQYDLFKKAASAPSSPEPSTPVKRSITEVAKDVIAGKYGNGDTRLQRLRGEGYNPAVVQAEVNRLKAGDKPPVKTVRQIAGEVIDGKWSDGQQRLRALRAAGYDPSEVQAEVNRLLQADKNRGTKSIGAVASEIIAGRGGWGNDPQRSQRLKRAGYDPEAVQREVNKRS